MVASPELLDLGLQAGRPALGADLAMALAGLTCPPDDLHPRRLAMTTPGEPEGHFLATTGLELDALSTSQDDLSCPTGLGEKVEAGMVLV